MSDGIHFDFLNANIADMLSAGAPLRRGDHAALSTGGKLHAAVSKQTEAASQNVSCRQSGTRLTL